MAPTQWLTDAVTSVTAWTAKSPSPSPSPSLTPSPAESEQTVVETVGRVLAWPVVILLIIVAAVFVRMVLNRLIDRGVMRLSTSAMSRRLAATGSTVGAETESELAERLRLRGRTVSSVLKSLDTLLIFGTAVIVILATVGVDIAPLLVSAGVVGIAIGFGAQSLVKDFLTGVFMILEDQYAVGDVIDTGDAVGTVVSVGLRLTQIRDDQGIVWYVPNGSIQRVGNRSQGFGLAVVDIPLAYGADVDRAGEVVSSSVSDLCADPAWAKDVLGEPPLIALDSMTPNALNLQVRLRTKPLRGVPVGRALRERVLTDLDAAGIPRPTGVTPPVV